MAKEKPEGWSLERISRRKALTRVAAGTALAWSAPVISSLRTPAFAQYPACAEPPCGPACGGPDTWLECAPTFTCICIQTIEGTCACIQTNVIDPGGPTPCTASSQCSAGAVCVNDTCIGDICQPLCAGGAAAGTDRVNSR